MNKLASLVDLDKLEQYVNIDAYITHVKDGGKRGSRLSLVSVCIFVCLVSFSGIATFSYFALSSRMQLIYGSEIANSIYIRIISITVFASIPLFISMILSTIKSGVYFNKDNPKAFFEFLKVIDSMMIAFYILLLQLGTMTLIIYLRNTIPILATNIIISVLIIINVLSLYVFRDRGITIFINPEAKIGNSNRIENVLKKSIQLLPILVVISFMLSPGDSSMNQRVMAALAPLMLVITVFMNYIFYCFGRKRYYFFVLLKLYSEEFREILGESEVDFYGKNYMESKSVMRKIETYKIKVDQTKNKEW